MIFQVCISTWMFAMILKGYDLDNKKNITKWLVENSWGEDIGMKGEYIMSNNWFKKY